MTVIGVDGRTYKDQASADKAAARMAKAPKLDGSATTNNTTTTTPKTTTPTTSTTSTNKSSNVQWSSSNYKDSDGYYSGTERNAATGGSEFGGSSKTSTQTSNQTSTSAQTPSSNYSTRPSDILTQGQNEYDPNTGYYRASQTQQGGDTSGKQVGGQKTIYNSDQIRATWDKLPYEEQQKRLQASPGLKDELAKMGITIKPKPGTTGETPTTPTTTGGDGWDYQDNSPERMKQIADNVNQFAQTDPYIFNNEDSFRKFFIDGKGRTPEQEAFLMDLYKNRKKYNELDNYTADNIGNMAVNGQIPDSYLTYLKNTNPDRYAAVMDAKARETDKIKDKASMDTISSMDGGADYTSQTSTVIEWLKSQGLLVDKDGNLIDDRTENYASEEEKGYLKQIADLNATNLDIDNTVKHAYEDLVKAYPGATKATLMAMAQDMNSDLLREKENNLVELTRLQGYVGYMQSERQERDTVGQNAINQLQKQYGMYYTYSPEGMSQLAQAQYAATNVTLDQADNGTDTQKQMALQRVLDDYYAKYGDIIQRSEAQVINDVMAYAKNNGVSLSQALEENFLKYLRQKPGFEQLNQLTSSPDVVRIGTDANGNPIYGTYNSATGKFDMIDLSGYGIGTNGYTTGTGNKVTTPGGVSYTAVSEADKINGLSDFLSGVNVGDYGGWCGAFVNDYLQSIGTGRIYDNNLSTKVNSATSKTPTIGSVAVFDYSNAPASSKISDDARKYGHVAIVTDINEKAGTITIAESNKDGDKLIGTREIPMNNMYLKGYFNPSEGYTGATTPTDNFGGRFANDPDWNTNGYFNALLPFFKTLVKDGKIDLTDTKYKDVLNDYGITSKEFYEMAKNYANTELKSGGGQQAANALEFAVKLYDLVGNKSTVPGRTLGQALWRTDNSKAKDEYNSLMDRLSLKELFAAKELGATFGAMSDSEWSLLKNASTDLNWYNSNFSDNLEYLIESLYDAALDGKGTLPRNFAGSNAEQMLKTRKAEGSGIGGGKFQSNGQVNDIYSDLY